MITAVVRFRLPEGTTRDDAKAMFEKSAPNYRGVPGLIRKYYLYGDDRTGGGVYLWNSREAAERFYSEAWKSTIAQRYGAQPESHFTTPRSSSRTRTKKPVPRERLTALAKQRPSYARTADNLTPRQRSNPRVTGLRSGDRDVVVNGLMMCSVPRLTRQLLLPPGSLSTLLVSDKFSEPSIRRLWRAFERLEIDVNHAEAAAVALRPLEVIEQRPDEIAA